MCHMYVLALSVRVCDVLERHVCATTHSQDQMAEYDIPAKIDYVLQQTGQSSLAYVGHSEGVVVCVQWCVVCGVWCVVCGVWCVVCGVWGVVCGVWCVGCGVGWVCEACGVFRGLCCAHSMLGRRV